MADISRLQGFFNEVDGAPGTKHRYPSGHPQYGTITEIGDTIGRFVPSNLVHVDKLIGALIAQKLIDPDKGFVACGGDARDAAVASLHGLDAIVIEYNPEIASRAKDHAPDYLLKGLFQNQLRL